LNPSGVDADTKAEVSLIPYAPIIGISKLAKYSTVEDLIGAAPERNIFALSSPSAAFILESIKKLANEKHVAGPSPLD